MCEEEYHIYAEPFEKLKNEFIKQIKNGGYSIKETNLIKLCFGKLVHVFIVIWTKKLNKEKMPTTEDILDLYLKKVDGNPEVKAYLLIEIYRRKNTRITREEVDKIVFVLLNSGLFINEDVLNLVYLLGDDFLDLLDKMKFLCKERLFSSSLNDLRT